MSPGKIKLKNNVIFSPFPNPLSLLLLIVVIFGTRKPLVRTLISLKYFFKKFECLNISKKGRIRQRIERNFIFQNAVGLQRKVNFISKKSRF